MIHSNLKCINLFNARSLYIDTSFFSEIESQKDQEGVISSVLIQESLRISLGDQISVKYGSIDSLYDVKQFYLTEQKNIIIHSDILTKSAQYLVPLLNKSEDQLKFYEYFSNAYLTSDFKFIGLLYRFSGTHEYELFEESIKRFRLFKKQVDYDRFHKIYLFRIPESFYADINAFFEGKFSNMSDKLKRMMLKFYGASKNSRLYHSLHKTPLLKELMEIELDTRIADNLELVSIPIFNEEILPSSINIGI
jgi:hypothetical protein